MYAPMFVVDVCTLGCRRRSGCRRAGRSDGSVIAANDAQVVLRVLEHLIGGVGAARGRRRRGDEHDQGDERGERSDPHDGFVTPVARGKTGRFHLHPGRRFGEDRDAMSADDPSATNSSGAALLAAGPLGALVAVSLGVYGNVHDPASDLSITLGFADTITMKVWLATLAVLFAVVQLALRALDVRKGSARCRPGVAGVAAPDLGPARVPAHAAGRLPVPVPAGVRGLVDPSAAALAAGLRVLRSVRREDRRRPLARAAGDGAPAGGRCAVHVAGRCVADERLVVHLENGFPSPWSCSRGSTTSSRR